MKRLHLFGIVILLLFGLLAWGIGPVIAQEYTKIDKPFGIDESDTVHKIPKGSTIYHRPGGITEIRSANTDLILTAKNSEAALITTPNGLRRATHVVQVPPDARIIEEGNITRIYDEKRCILTVVEQENNRKSGYTVPDWDDWIEWSHDWSVDEIDWFRAYWEVPFDPKEPDDHAIDFLFNGIEDQQGNTIIQPVLEWNQVGSGRWTGAAWYSNGTSYRATPVNASEGDLIRGTIDHYYGNLWYIQFYNVDDSTSSSLLTSALGQGDEDLAIFCALEGENIDDNNDVPGDTGFYDMEFKHDGNTVDIEWDDEVENVPGLTGLDVVYDTSPPVDDTWVVLYTDGG